MENSYYEQRESNSIDRIYTILRDMPYFVQDFIVGVEPRTSVLTRLNYVYDLRVFFDFLLKKIFKDKKSMKDFEVKDLDKLSAIDIEYFLSYLSHYEINGKEERCTETGKARKLSTLRAFYKHFFNKDAIIANIPAKVTMPKIHEKEIIRLDNTGSKNEISEMLYVVETGEGLTKRQMSYHNNTKVRDCAIVTLFLGTGIRISELVGLNVSDIDLESHSFVVTRKGGNRDILYFNDEVASAIDDYLTVRNTAKIPNGENALFLSLQNKRICVRQVEQLVKKYAKIASPLKKITPHKLRSTFGTNLYRQTKDIYIVANCLGHKDVNTTRKHYAAITDDLKKQVGKSVSIANNIDEDNKK